jgi:cytochrome c biogenesis protein CcmG/thiol:disulfide interchange protein DsbE
MWTSWKFWAVLAGIGSVVAVFVYGFTVDPKLVKSPLLGKPAPGFSITRLGGNETLTLADLKGKPVVLNFWASWCAACRDEAHLLQATHTVYEKQKKELRVIGIAIQDTEEKALAFARRFGKTYFLGMDTPAGDISLSYGIYGVPETFFLDGNGVIQYKQIGAVTADVIEEQVKMLTGQTGEKTR